MHGEDREQIYKGDECSAYCRWEVKTDVATLRVWGGGREAARE